MRRNSRLDNIRRARAAEAAAAQENAATVDHAAFRALIASSADVARVALCAGLSVNVVRDAQYSGFAGQGFSEDAAATLTRLIMEEALNGFTFDADRAENLKNFIADRAAAIAAA